MTSFKNIPRVVLDTNVLVSGLLTPLGPSARLMDLAQRGEIRVLYDDRIFQEYQQVLKRPRFGFSSQVVELFLEFLKAEGEHIVAKPIHAAGVHVLDQPFLETALSGQAEFLVTGNQRHYPQHPPRGLSIVGPSEALRHLTAK